MEYIIRDFQEAAQAASDMGHALHLYDADPTEESIELAAWYSNFLEYTMKYFAKELKKGYEEMKKGQPATTPREVTKYVRFGSARWVPGNHVPKFVQESDNGIAVLIWSEDDEIYICRRLCWDAGWRDDHDGEEVKDFSFWMPLPNDPPKPELIG